MESLGKGAEVRRLLRGRPPRSSLLAYEGQKMVSWAAGSRPTPGKRKVQNAKCKVQSAKFRVKSSEFRVQSEEFRVKSSECPERGAS